LSPLLAQLNAFLNGHSAAICSTASSKSSLLRRSDAILPSASGEDAFRTSFNWYPAFDPLSIFYCRTQYPALNRASQFATACMSLCRDSTKSGTTRHRLVSLGALQSSSVGQLDPMAHLGISAFSILNVCWRHHTRARTAPRRMLRLPIVTRVAGQALCVFSSEITLCRGGLPTPWSRRGSRLGKRSFRTAVGIKSGKCREEVARLDWLAATGTREHTLALTAGTLKHQRWTINSPCHTSVPEFPHYDPSTETSKRKSLSKNPLV
jgi:hypothetical protein